MNRCFTILLSVLIIGGMVGCRSGRSRDTDARQASVTFATVEEAEVHAQRLLAKSYRTKYQTCLDRAAEWRRRAEGASESYAARALNKAERYEIKAAKYLRAATDCEQEAAVLEKSTARK